MRLVTETSPPECAAVRQVSGSRGGRAVVLVGVKLDSRSRELLTWALVKVASPGDRVIALNIIDPNADKSSLLSLVKTFDSALAAFEGFCSLKQVDLRLKVCRGTSIRRILSQEAELCGATSLVIGISEVNHTIRSRISVAKYCAKNLHKSVSITCVDNGKILFQRESIFLSDAREFKRRKFLSRSLLGLPPLTILSSCASRSKGIFMDLEPIRTHEIPEYKFGWVKLRKLLLKGGRMSDISSTNKSSVVQLLSKTPSEQSIVAIYLDQKQIEEFYRNGLPGLDEEDDGAIQYSPVNNADFHSTKIFREEFKDFVEKYSTTCQLFSYQELLLATDNFSHNNLIGKGGHSLVYRGCQPGGGEIAVKILKPSEDVLKHFVSEVQLITSLHHKNIVSLVGFCFDEDQLLLVYDYVSRGCLEENLHVHESGTFLGWPERYTVALGVAEALNCLHSATESIIHGDVKSSNILLADNFEPRLSDFGLATWASSCSYHMDTSDVAGTFGYLAPEYFMHGKLNEKIDVYAFGVVLLELLSGRKPIDNGNPKGQESLVIWVNHILKEENFSELQDCRLANAWDSDEYERMVVAATLCIRQEPQSRPMISTVLKILQGDPEAVEWARQETNTSENIHGISGEQSTMNIQSFINLALYNLEDDDATSISSSEQNISVEDYLQGRWSRSSSFNKM